MSTAAPLIELLAIEKLCEREFEEARMIERSKLPARPFHEFGIVISHEFQAVPEGGGDFLESPYPCRCPLLNGQLFLLFI